ncbi:MAG: hypothetical protein RhofKO_05190 [Rhodothermales bacterium]
MHEQQRTLTQLAQFDAELHHLDTAYIQPFYAAPAALSDSSIAAYQTAMAQLRVAHLTFIPDTDGLLATLDSAMVSSVAPASRREAQRHAEVAEAAMTALRLYWGDALRYHGHARLEATPLKWWMGGVIIVLALVGVMLTVGYWAVRHQHQVQTHLDHAIDVRAWAFQHHPLPMLRLDTEYTIVGVNAAFIAWTGYTRETIQGQLVQTLFPNAEFGRPNESRRRRRIEQSYTVQTDVRTAAGEMFVADVFGLITTAPGDGQVSHDMVFIDRTREHTLEADAMARVKHVSTQYAALQAMTDRGFKAVKHIFDQCAGQAEALRPMVFPGREEAVVPLVQNVRQGVRLVAEAQAWMQLHASPLTPSDLDLSTLVQQVVRKVARQYPGVRVEWRSETQQACVAHGDESLLRQLLMWGVTEACRTKKQGVLPISVWVAGQDVGVTVQSTAHNAHHQQRHANLGHGESWAMLAAEEMGGRLSTWTLPNGEVGFAVQVPQAALQVMKRRQAA